MTTNNSQQTKPMYSVHCTECGDVIEGKFFPMENLLERYSPGESVSLQREELIRVLGVGARYGGNVLPEVPPLLRYLAETEEKPASWEIQRPDIQALRTKKSPLQCFECRDNNEVPVEKLTEMTVNIGAIVAQFCLESGFPEIYDMLEIQNRMEQQTNFGELPAPEDKSRLGELCQKFATLPGVRLSRMTAAGMREAQIVGVLSIALLFAREEAESGRRNFTAETLLAGWRYQEINGIRMPHSLVVVGANSRQAYHCAKCCCDKCRGELPIEMGAYPQRIVGILGTQATGKTTYLAALANAIDVGEATSCVQGNGSQQYTNIQIDHNASDPQWRRVLAGPEAGEGVEAADAKIGALWLYQNGYPPRKTPPDQPLETPALTLLVHGAGETVMYTLADIAGEVFTNDERYAQYREKMRKLLYSSDALMMVISTGQMSREAQAEANQKLVLNPSEILTYYADFLPNHSIPTAVVMTSSDKINGGDLRQPLNLAYDIRRCSPLVWDGRRNYLVYNAEAMASGIQAVRVYINKYFGSFMENLLTRLKNAGKQEPQVAAFVVSNGTQWAPGYYGEVADGAYDSQEQRTERYARMRAERFGVVSPFLWLLACDGILEVGRADSEFNDYPGKTQEAISNLLRKFL